MATHVQLDSDERHYYREPQIIKPLELDYRVCVFGYRLHSTCFGLLSTYNFKYRPRPRAANKIRFFFGSDTFPLLQPCGVSERAREQAVNKIYLFSRSLASSLFRCPWWRFICMWIQLGATTPGQPRRRWPVHHWQYIPGWQFACPPPPPALLRERASVRATRTVS